MPRHTLPDGERVFVPHPECTVASGACFDAGECMDNCQRKPAGTLTERLQRQCVAWGAYWRASDAHGVELTPEQALQLLRDALGVEVEIKPPQSRSCKLIECLGRPRCASCLAMDQAYPPRSR